MKRPECLNRPRRRFLKTLVLAGAAAAVDWNILTSQGFAEKENTSTSVVVIGSGLGGLVAAAYLAKKGFNVTVIEQHDIPGGYATSFERDNGNFVFDVSLHATVAKNAMPQRILSELGAWNKLDVANVPELARIITPAHDITLPSGNPAAFTRILGSHFPHEQDGINGFISDMVHIQETLHNRNVRGEALMERLEGMTLAQWLDSHVEDPEVRDYLAALCGYFGQAPGKLNALFYAITAGEYLVSGGNYYKTRSQSLSNALAGVITENNGRILFNTEVRQILTSQKVASDTYQVTGVLDDSGRIHPAGAVIANAGAPTVFKTMLPRNTVPEPYRQRLAGIKPSLSSFIVWLGLDRELPDVREYEILLKTEGDMESRFQHLRTGDPALSDLSVTLYDNLYKGYSQPGTSTITLMSLAGFDHWKPFETDYIKKQKEAYEKEKYRIADAFIKRIEQRLIPGLSDMVRVIEVGTPLTNQRFTRNPAGAIYGFDSNGTTLGCRTPVSGLYLAGAWSHGGGYTQAMMAGRDAATMASRHLSGPAWHDRFIISRRQSHGHGGNI